MVGGSGLEPLTSAMSTNSELTRAWGRTSDKQSNAFSLVLRCWGKWSLSPLNLRQEGLTYPKSFGQLPKGHSIAAVCFLLHVSPP